MRPILLSAIVSFALCSAFAQTSILPDTTGFMGLTSLDSVSLKKPKFWKKSEWIVPASFIASGAVVAINRWDEFFLSNREIREERNRYFPKFSNDADNYLQVAPMVAVFALRSCGIRGRNDLANQFMIMLKTELLITAIVTPLKTIAAEPRPDTGAKNSFPSGHTTQAFAAATIFAKEYGHRSPWYAVGAYTVATTVGAMRILNNRHWFSDVLAGAGIGILSANLVYATHRHKWGTHINAKTRAKRNNELVVTPTYGYTGNTGLYMSYKF